MKFFLTVVLVFLFFSCQKKKEDNIENNFYKGELSVVKDFKQPNKVLAKFSNEIENWEELTAVNDFLLRFKKVSPNEILSNADELKLLTKALKDSIKPKLFNVPSLNARIHIFNNEVLRLADMTKIPSIKANEVSEQSKKVIETFSGINAKINTIISKKRFKDEIQVNVDFIGIDSTNLDTISKNSIQKKLEEKAKLKSQNKLKRKKFIPNKTSKKKD